MCPRRPRRRALPAAVAGVVLVVVAALAPQPTAGDVPNGGAYFPFDTPREVAATAVSDVLGRPATATEVSTYAAKVAAGVTSGSLRTTLHRSDEFARVVAPATRLYRAYYLRDPDPGGLSYWLGRLHDGFGLRNVSDYFARSSEFVNRYGLLGDAAFVDLVFLNVLDRRPDPDGRTYWTSQLISGAKTRGDVMIGFSESSEYGRKTADAVLVATTYLSTLRRRPTADEQATWQARLEYDATDATIIGELSATTDFERRITLLSNGGSPDAWSYLSGAAKPSRWDPCTPIRWALNPSRVPAHAVVDIEEALRRISVATGLQFTRVPDITNGYVPWAGADYLAGYPEGVDLVIAYTDASVIPGLAGGVVGLGGSGAWWRDGAFNQSAYGGIALDAADGPVRTAGFLSSAAHGNVVLHEIGHVVGLGHAAEEVQLMNSYLNPFNGRRFGSGDLTGLRTVGAANGCFPATRSLAPAQPIAPVALP